MKNILVVDDSEETVELIKMVFSGASEIHIDYATSSREAIPLLNTNSYNACVLDVSLPDITGYYLGELIRKSCGNMPIAFLTNYEGNYTKENAEVISAEFWPKSDVFASPLKLREMFSKLASDESCCGNNTIQLPEIFNQL